MDRKILHNCKTALYVSGNIRTRAAGLQDDTILAYNNIASSTVTCTATVAQQQHSVYRAYRTESSLSNPVCMFIVRLHIDQDKYLWYAT